MRILPSIFAVGIIALGASGLANASAIHFDLASGSPNFGGELPGSGAQGEGNSLQYSNAGINLVVRSYTLLDSDVFFSASDTRVYSAGLGVCNSNELAGTCSTGPHAMDNNGSRDVLVFVFDHVMDFSSLNIGWVGDDADIDWVVGRADLGFDLSGIALADVGMQLTINNTGHNEGNSVRTASISGLGNVLIVGTQFDETNDGVKIKKITATAVQPVPLPPAVFLMLTGLLSLFGVRRRKS